MSRPSADARLPADHQGPALTGASSRKELVEDLAFAAPVPQLRGEVAAGRRVAIGPTPTLRHPSTTPQHGPLLGASCSAISIEASMGNLLIEGQPK